MSDDRFEVEGIHCDDDERVSGKRFSTSNYHEIRTPAYLKQMHNGVGVYVDPRDQPGYEERSS